MTQYFTKSCDAWEVLT